MLVLGLCKHTCSCRHTSVELNVRNVLLDLQCSSGTSVVDWHLDRDVCWIVIGCV
jgi:hypothetical protein